MKNLGEVKEVIDKHKNILREKYGIVRVAIFGSYVRNERGDSSDIDILVELEKPLVTEFVNIADYLEEIFGERIELAKPLALKQRPRLWKSVEEDCIYV